MFFKCFNFKTYSMGRWCVCRTICEGGGGGGLEDATLVSNDDTRLYFDTHTHTRTHSHTHSLTHTSTTYEDSDGEREGGGVSVDKSKDIEHLVLRSCMLDLTRRIKVRHPKRGEGGGTWGRRTGGAVQSVTLLCAAELYICVTANRKNCAYSSAGSRSPSPERHQSRR